MNRVREILGWNGLLHTKEKTPFCMSLSVRESSTSVSRELTGNVELKASHEDKRVKKLCKLGCDTPRERSLNIQSRKFIESASQLLFS